jgi:hypothetical protein
MTDTFKKAVLATRKLFGFDISPKPSPHLRARATSQDSSLRQGSKRKAVIDLRQIRKRPRYMGNRYEEADLYEGSEARKSMRRKGKQLGDRMHKQATRYPNVNGTGSVGVTTLRGMDVDTFKQATQDTVEDITEIIMDSGFPPDTKVHALREVAEELTDEARHVKDIANDIRPYPSGDILESTWTTPVPAPTTPDVDEYEDETPWDHEPNSQARKVLASVNGDVRKARRFIQMDFQRNGLIPEPEYALREAEIRDGLWQVMDKMEQFTKKYFDFTGFNDVPKNRTILHERFLKHLQPETIRVIGFVASGGPGGDDGWRELFFNRQKRRALICAIIGNVVTEQVYQHAFFGGQDREMRQLEEIQIEHHNDDGTLP